MGPVVTKKSDAGWVGSAGYLPTYLAEDERRTESPTKYARSGNVYIAYRVFGDGPRDVILVPGTISHVELYWELPTNEYLLKRLCAFARVIVFDKRRQGLSDRVAEQTIDERMADVSAVMDAAGSKRATVFGWSEGGPMSLFFAATYPERTSALVLFGTFASMKAEPWAMSQELFDQFTTAVEAHWGEGILVPLNAPSRANDKGFVQWFRRLERAASSPRGIQALFRADYENDARHLLPSIRVPTLILHRKDDSTIPVAADTTWLRRSLARSTSNSPARTICSKPSIRMCSIFFSMRSRSSLPACATARSRTGCSPP